MKEFQSIAVNLKSITITGASELDLILTQDLYSVTSSAPVNGASEFLLAVLKIGVGDYNILQTQIALSNGTLAILSRNHLIDTFSPWKTSDLAAAARPEKTPGFSMLDTTLGKPIWLKSIAPDINEVCALEITAINTQEVAELAIIAVNTSEVCTLEIIATNTPEVAELTCGAATASGTVTVTLNGVDKEIEVTAGDTAADVAETIAVKSFPGWTAVAEGNVVTFTKDVAGACTAPAFVDTDTTGATGVFEVTTPGVAVAEGTLTITLNEVPVEVEIAALDTDDQIAAKIQLTAFAGWVATVEDNIVTFTKTVPGACTAPAFVDTDTTGATGTFEVTTEGVAVAAGAITVTLNAIDVEVEIAARDSSAQVATKIQQTAFAGWVATVDDNVVTFTKAAIGSCSAPEFEDTDSTSVTASFDVITPGSKDIWVDATGTEV